MLIYKRFDVFRRFCGMDFEVAKILHTWMLQTVFFAGFFFLLIMIFVSSFLPSSQNITNVHTFSTFRSTFSKVATLLVYFACRGIEFIRFPWCFPDEALLFAFALQESDWIGLSTAIPNLDPLSTQSVSILSKNRTGASRLRRGL